MVASEILSLASTSWRLVLLSWTMPKDWPLLQQFLLDAKVIERRKGAVTYLQRAEDIMDFLIVIGAMQARDNFERVKILRETRNDLNRANNAETANIARTVSASMKTINNISKIKKIEWVWKIYPWICKRGASCESSTRLLYPAVGR